MLMVYFRDGTNWNRGSGREEELGGVGGGEGFWKRELDEAGEFAGGEGSEAAVEAECSGGVEGGESEEGRGGDIGEVLSEEAEFIPDAEVGV